MSDTITKEERAELRTMINAGVVVRLKDGTILRLLDALEAEEARSEKAEAQVARLTEERDWLATQLACIQSAYDIDQKTRDWSTARWAEAARKASKE